MGATYTRQSSYSDGDVITAAHTNDEFNQLLAAFASSSGHTHDGTAALSRPPLQVIVEPGTPHGFKAICHMAHLLDKHSGSDKH